MAAVAAIATIAIAAGSTMYSIDQSQKAQAQQEKQAQQQKAQQDALIQQQKDKEAQLQAQAFAKTAQSKATTKVINPIADNNSIGGTGAAPSAASKTLIGS